MAKINSITMGKAKGSLGNVTLRTSKGIVIASQKQDKKGQGASTYNQVSTQVTLSNIVHAYKALNANGMLQKAFTSLRGRESNYNAFVRMNKAVAEVNAIAHSKEEADAKLITPAPFIIADGSLTAPSEMVALYSSVNKTIPLAPSTNYTNHGDLSADLIARFGCQDGDILTMVLMGWTNDPKISANFVSRKLKVDSTSTDTLPAFVTAAGVISFPSFRIVTTGTECSIIKGRNDGGEYKSCKAQFGDSMTIEEPYLTMVSAENVAEAIASYQPKAEPYLQSDPQ